MSAAGRVAAGERARPPRYLHSASGSRYRSRRGGPPARGPPRGGDPGGAAGPGRRSGGVHDRAGDRAPRRGADAPGGRPDRLRRVALPRLLDQLSARRAAGPGRAAEDLRHVAAGLADRGGGHRRGRRAAGLSPRPSPGHGGIRPRRLARGGRRDGISDAARPQPTRGAAGLRGAAGGAPAAGPGRRAGGAGVPVSAGTGRGGDRRRVPRRPSRAARPGDRSRGGGGDRRAGAVLHRRAARDVARHDRLLRHPGSPAPPVPARRSTDRGGPAS